MSESEKEGTPGEDELLEEQTRKGYGEDEGERDEALEREQSEPS